MKSIIKSSSLPKDRRNKKEKIQRYITEIVKNLVFIFLFFIILIEFPLVSVLQFKSKLPLISLIYSCIGLALLWLDEKFKMERRTLIFGRFNTFFLDLLDCWHRLKLFIKILIQELRPAKSECEITFDLVGGEIHHDYAKFDDKQKRMDEMLDSFESDLRSLRYFSEVRKFGYLLIAIGYIMQAAVIIHFQSRPN